MSITIYEIQAIMIYYSEFFKSRKSKFSNTEFKGKFFFYELLKVNRQLNGNLSYLVCIEPTELTLLSTNDTTAYTNILLKLPFQYTEESIQEYNLRIKGFLFNHDNKENLELLDCFLLDLFCNNYFKDSGRVEELKELILGMPILRGYSFKIIFETLYDEILKFDRPISDFEKLPSIDLSFSKNKTSRAKRIINYFQLLWDKKKYGNEIKQKYTNKYNPIIEKMNHYYNNWLRFIYDKRNEEYFSLSIFDSTDIELLTARQKMDALKLENKIYGSIVPLTKQVQNYKSNKYLIGRYGLVEGLSLNPWLAILSSMVVLITLGLIFTNTLFFAYSDITCPLVEFQFYIMPYALFTVLVLLPIIFWLKKASFPGIILPRLVVALFSGWLIFLTAEDIMKIDYGIGGFHLFALCSGLLLFLYLFLYNEIRNAASSLRKRLIIFRITQIFSISLIISYSIGFFLMSFVNSQFLGLDSFIVANSSIERGSKLIQTKYELLENLRSEMNILKATSEDKASLFNQKRLRKKLFSSDLLKGMQALKYINKKNDKKLSDSNILTTIDSLLLLDTKNFKEIQFHPSQTLLKRFTKSILSEEYDFSSPGNQFEIKDSFSIKTLDSFLVNILKLPVHDRLNNKLLSKYLEIKRLKYNAKPYDLALFAHNIWTLKNKVSEGLNTITNKFELGNSIEILTATRDQYTVELDFAKSIYQGNNKISDHHKINKFRTHADSIMIRIDSLESIYVQYPEGSLNKKKKILNKIKKLADISTCYNYKLPNFKEKILEEKEKLRIQAREDRFKNESQNEIIVKSQTVKFKRKYSFLCFSFDVYPNMTLFRSLIALFLGIFLQLIVQKKTITEPI